MKLTLEFDTGNAEFEDNNGNAIADVMDRMAGRIRRDTGNTQAAWEYAVLDVNGNTIGVCRLEHDRCKMCLDVAGRDGLGRTCKGCNGTGYATS